MSLLKKIYNKLKKPTEWIEIKVPSFFHKKKEEESEEEEKQEEEE